MVTLSACRPRPAGWVSLLPPEDSGNPLPRMIFTLLIFPHGLSLGLVIPRFHQIAASIALAGLLVIGFGNTLGRPSSRFSNWFTACQRCIHCGETLAHLPRLQLQLRANGGEYTCKFLIDVVEALHMRRHLPLKGFDRPSDRFLRFPQCAARLRGDSRKFAKASKYSIEVSAHS